MWLDVWIHSGVETELMSCDSYEHQKIDEPAIMLGSAFVVEVTESAHDEGVEKGKEKEKEKQNK